MERRRRCSWSLALPLAAALLAPAAVASAQAPTAGNNPLAETERRLSKPVQATVHAVTPPPMQARSTGAQGAAPPAASHSNTAVEVHVDTQSRSGSFRGAHGPCAFAYTVRAYPGPDRTHPTHAGPIAGQCAGEGGLKGGWILQRDGTIQASVTTQAGREYHFHF